MKYTVIGAGKSGLAAALLARELGHGVFLSELKPIDCFKIEVGKWEVGSGKWEVRSAKCEVRSAKKRYGLWAKRGTPHAQRALRSAAGGRPRRADFCAGKQENEG